MKKLDFLKGKWIDVNASNEEFTGNVLKDLNVGDKAIKNKDGKRYEVTIVNKVVNTDGFIFVTTKEVEVI